jgi:hypothetical protein
MSYIWLNTHAVPTVSPIRKPTAAIDTGSEVIMLVIENDSFKMRLILHSSAFQLLPSLVPSSTHSNHRLVTARSPRSIDTSHPQEDVSD